MRTVQFQSHADADGLLKVEVPVGVTDTDVDVVVIVSPAGAAAGAPDGSWPPRFFEETFGCLAAYPLERPPQGEFEIRNTLK